MPTHSKSLNKPLNDLRVALSELQKIDFGAGEMREESGVSDGKRFLSLAPDQEKLMNRCVESLHVALPQPEAFAQADVEKLVVVAILDALLKSSQPDSKRLNNAMSRLAEEFLNPLPLWEVHQPVIGLYAEGLPVSFGKIAFYSGVDSKCRALSKGIARVVKKGGDTPEAKKGFVSHWKNQLNKNIKGKTYCSTIVQACSSKAATGLALRELALTIDVINLFADLTIKTGNGARLSLIGDAHRTRGFSLMFLLPAEKAHRAYGVVQNANSVSLSNYMAGPLSLFSMGESARKALKKYGWERASEILAKDSAERTEMENRILAAMRWAGRATLSELRDEDKRSAAISLEVEQAFLLYAIALESLLLKKGGEVNYRFGLRSSHLLGVSISQRIQIQEDMKTLYALRSDVVHNGRASISTRQLAQLRSYTKRAIFTMLMRRPFRTMKKEIEFEDWFEKKLLS